MLQYYPTLMNKKRKRVVIVPVTDSEVQFNHQLVGGSPTFPVLSFLQNKPGELGQNASVRWHCLKEKQ